MKLSITNGQYKSLRNDPDFKALVQAGRALNAIAFGMKILSSNRSGTSSVDQRQARRSITVIAGFLHEARLLADRLKNTYRGKPYILGLTKLQNDPSYRNERKLLRDLRNRVSFHLDHRDESVGYILAELDSLGDTDLEQIDFYESSDGSMNEFTFPFGDLIDFNYSIRKAGEIFGKDSIADPELRENESIQALMDSILTFGAITIKAYDEFIEGLSKELRI